MKKTAIIPFLVSLILLFSSLMYSTAAFAAPVLSRIQDVSCAAAGNQVAISIKLDAYKGYSVKELKNPYRIAIDIPNAVVPSNQQKIDVKSSMVKSVRYAQNDRTTARVVIDAVGQPQYYVVEKTGKLVVYVVTPLANGLSYYNEGGAASFLLPGVKLTGKKLYTEKYEQSGKKYTLTFASSLAKLDNKTVKLNDSLISSVQIVKNAKTKNTSLVITAKAKYTYSVTYNTKTNRTQINVTRGSAGDRGDDGTVVERIPQLREVKYTPNGSSDTVDIFADSYSGYSIMRLTGSNRIVIDIPNVQAPADQQTVPVNSSLITAVRYAQNDNSTARVVIDTTGQMQYHVMEKSGQLSLTIETPKYRNITYSNNGDRVFLQLDGAALTGGSWDSQAYYTGSYDDSGLNYTVTFPNSLADVGSGVLQVNDGLLNSVEIIQSDTEAKTSVIFHAKDKFVYNISTRTIPSTNTAITLLKPSTKEDKLVVIDPGHGGDEPGAVSGDYKEKDFNLDISMRLNALLKSHNIKTYMTRENDSYVGLYERAYIANKLNASLFLCVHNNAYYESYKGTETLYTSQNPNDTALEGKKFAQIIQNSMLGTLGTQDRKLSDRPELVVLKATTMPAALAEVAFLTNKEDRARLVTEGFRQQAAQALCDAVLKELGMN